MSKFAKSVENIFRGIGKAFFRYPISMVTAFLVALIGIIFVGDIGFFEIKFLTALQVSLLLCGAIGMVISALIQKFELEFEVKILMYIATVGIAAAAFSALNFNDVAVNIEILPRLGALMIICFLVFLVIPSYKNDKYDFNDTVFMNLKGYFIAGIYSLVILLGLYAVTFAFQSLIYSDLSSKVYAYIGLFSLFLWYAFYLGHLPDFSERETDAAIDRAIRQPKFIEILNQYILVPLIGLMSLVLIVWIGRILIFQTWPTFGMVSGIFVTYSVLGILLYVLVSKKELKVSQLYRRIFPIIALVFLGFEGYSAWKEFVMNGLSTFTYFVVLILLGTASASIVFIFNSVKRNRFVAYILVVMTVISVTPVIGYMDLPGNENFAIERNYMKDNYPDPNDKSTNLKVDYIIINVKDEPLDITGYKYSLTSINDFSEEFLVFNKKDHYLISFESNEIYDGKGDFPRIRIKKNGVNYVNQSMEEYLRGMFNKYKKVGTMYSENERALSSKLMSYAFEKEGLKIKIFFSWMRMDKEIGKTVPFSVGVAVSQILVGF